MSGMDSVDQLTRQTPRELADMALAWQRLQPEHGDIFVFRTPKAYPRTNIEALVKLVYALTGKQIVVIPVLPGDEPFDFATLPDRAMEDAGWQRREKRT